MLSERTFSQSTLDSYLRELAIEIRRIGGNATQYVATGNEFFQTIRDKGCRCACW